MPTMKIAHSYTDDAGKHRYTVDFIEDGFAVFLKYDKAQAEAAILADAQKYYDGLETAKEEMRLMEESLEPSNA